MSRRGNSDDNAVAESFFQLLKRERIKRKIYGTREETRSNIFDYIESLITVGVRMFRAIRCYRQDMKINIINGSEVSTLAVAIHPPQGCVIHLQYLLTLKFPTKIHTSPLHIVCCSGGVVRNRQG